MNATEWNPAVVVGLATPFLVLVGVLVKTGADWLVSKWANKHKSKELVISEKIANISETEAQTHQIQAIFEGFNTSLAVVSKRATDAENALAELRERSESALAELRGRVDKLEDEREEYLEERNLMIRHIVDLEQLVPSPPGPPDRPKW